MSNQKAAETRKMFTVSGFYVQRVETPEKIKWLKAFPQRKIIPHIVDGNAHYVYADADSCQCFYTGDEHAYQRYRELTSQQKRAVVPESTKPGTYIRRPARCQLCGPLSTAK